MFNPLKVIYDRLHPAPSVEPVSTPESRAEATEALAKASTDLNAIIRREPRITAVATKLRDQAERNHFGELVEASMRRA